jgi:hypothetical protein
MEGAVMKNCAVCGELPVVGFTHPETGNILCDQCCIASGRIKELAEMLLERAMKSGDPQQKTGTKRLIKAMGVVINEDMVPRPGELSH